MTLPDGAQLSLVYRASAKVWDGKLYIPAAHNALRDQGMLVFAESHADTAVIISALNMQYEKHEASLKRRKR